MSTEKSSKARGLGIALEFVGEGPYIFIVVAIL